MNLTLNRIFRGPDYTIGKLYIDGHYFCDTLEDPVRTLPASCPNTSEGILCACPEKVYARTAIPAGTYKVTMQFSPRFKRVLPLLHDVPHFLGVLIHSGNDPGDTAGCILVGHNKVKGKVLESRAVSDKLNALLEKENEMTITIC
ncbi:hypothetical protein DW189_11700 [Alistipes sp. AM16-43]|jgi:hypothetical protein|uniref:DUF5675 family protein n=1 Tax=Alistipes TaxID=239759 RepID=UPI000E41174A|nr:MULTISPECIES: DUF5675 family protein [Alistipes]RGF04308.1 hypothetical protein DW189_11700 [Alistipes sp. AM16-43]BBL02336.1 hypothetical protein A3BBH6_25720 [Alistipes onderdonkii subsp. vulgaris]